MNWRILGPLIGMFGFGCALGVAVEELRHHCPAPAPCVPTAEVREVRYESADGSSVVLRLDGRLWHMTIAGGAQR